jgi:hypothetical protein
LSTLTSQVNPLLTTFLDKLTEESEPLGHTLFQNKYNFREDIKWFQTLPYTPMQKKGVTCTDIVETSNWFPLNHAIPSHGLTDTFTYEDNVPSCPLPVLIFCIAPATFKRQA